MIPSQSMAIERRTPRLNISGQRPCRGSHRISAPVKSEARVVPITRTSQKENERRTRVVTRSGYYGDVDASGSGQGR